MNPVSRALIMRFAVLYPAVADILGWRRVDQDLQPGKVYTYRVTAVDRSARDAERTLGSARAVAKPSGVSAPSGVQVSQPAWDRLEVRWARDVGREQSEAVLRYVVSRREGAGPFVPLNPGLTPGLAGAQSAQGRYVDTGVLPGRTYQYAVAAMDLAGGLSAKSTAPSLKVADKRPPLPPLDLQLTLSERQVGLTWMSAGLAPDIREVEVLKVRSKGSEGGELEVLKVLGRVGATAGLYRTRAPGLGYHEYALRSVDSAGNRGPLSASVALQNDRELRLKTPGGVKATMTAEGHVQVSWRATPGTDAETYVIERQVSGSEGPPVQISAGALGVRDKVAIDRTPPLDGPPLSYRVTAMDPGGALSAASPWVRLKDLRRAPRALLASPLALREGVRLSWRAESTTFSAGFHVQVQVDEGPWRNLTSRPYAASTRSAIDTQVRPPEAFVRYRVQSLGGAPGDPIWSNTVSRRTHANVLVAPIGLSARCAPKGVDLTWKSSEGASSYEVQRAFGGDDFRPRVEVNVGRWRDESVMRARRYRYQVLARHGAEISTPSAPIEIICSAR